MIGIGTLQYLYKSNRSQHIASDNLSRRAEGDLLVVQPVFVRGPAVALDHAWYIGEGIDYPMTVAQPCSFAGVTAYDIGRD
jgi:hypothetical protein